MGNTIQRLKKGEGPTLMHADKGNELIGVCNGILDGMKVIPERAGRFVVTGGGPQADASIALELTMDQFGGGGTVPGAPIKVRALKEDEDGVLSVATIRIERATDITEE